MNTSYGIGDAFAHAIEDGLTAAQATEKEIETLQMIYKTPAFQLMLQWNRNPVHYDQL